MITHITTSREFAVNRTDAFASLDLFTQGYLTAAFALWREDDDPLGQTGEELAAEDLSPATLEQVKADCAAFQAMAGERIEGEERHAGVDFYLTRNGHGSGFWDGDWPEYGDVLTDMSKKFPEVDYYRGDDGKIYG